jgi:hypothetical protein
MVGDIITWNFASTANALSSSITDSSIGELISITVNGYTNGSTIINRTDAGRIVLGGMFNTGSSVLVDNVPSSTT